MRPTEIIRLTVIFYSFLFFFGTVRSYAQRGPTNYYVSPTANDLNPGTESLPWKTLAKAASMATANTTVFIKQGIYRERLVPVNSGTADEPITFTCYPGDSVTITGAGMLPPTGWWAGLIWMQGLRYIKISGIRVINSVNIGIDVENSSHITIEKNYVDSTYSSGIKVYACDNLVIDANEVVRGCIGSDLEECISIATTNLLEIRNNRVHDGRSIGIDVKYGSSNAMVSKNEVYNQNGGIGIYIEAWTLHEFNIDVFDNFSHDNGIGFAVTSEMGGLIEAVTIHHNVAYRNQQRGIAVVGWGGGQTHPVKNVKVYGNTVWENGFGIEIGGYAGTNIDSIKVFNNLIYHNKGVGVRITRYDGPSGQYTMRNVSIINNTIYGNGTVGNGWDADNGGMNIFNVNPENLLIRNNILSNNTVCTIYVSPEVLAGSVIIDFNFFEGFRNFVNETVGTNAIYGNPLFVDLLSNDYHLQAASPCIDKGHPDQIYNDPRDPNKPGYALYPAQGTVRNDMGAYGGPYAGSSDVLAIASPLAPTLAVPVDGAKSVSITPTLRWERAMGATTYRLQVSLNSWFSTTVVNDSTITETSKSLGPLQNGTTYFWRVNAKNEGGTSIWSQVRSFTTIVAAPLGPTYYVSPTGNDSNPGTESLPWKTLAKAASTATAGVTVFIKQGIYRERLVPVNSGTAEGPITFTCYPGDSVIMSGVGIKLPSEQYSDRWWSGLIHIENLMYIKLSGLRVVHSAASGILATNCSHIIIERNYTDSTFSPGIAVNGCDHLVVESNEVVHGCTGLDQECISVAASTLFEIKNNYVHDGFTEGIDVKVGSSNGIVAGNEVYNQSYRFGIYIEAWDKHEFNIDVFDNTSHDNVQGFGVASENTGLIEAIRIHHNKAYRNDRGIWVAGGGIGRTHPLRNIEIYCNTCYENRAGIDIGAFMGTNLDTLMIQNNLIFHNTNVGVGIYSDDPTGQYVLRNIEILNNTIFGNGTSSNAWGDGGINIANVSPQSVHIRNNILSANAAFTVCVQPEVPRANVTIDYNFFDGFRNYANETAGTNAVYGSPLFVDSLRNDYHLQTTSPCIDKGHPNREYNDPPDPNKPGYALYPAQGTLRNDMGAYGGPYATSWVVTTSVDDENADFSTLPEIFELYQNYPNPFNSSTIITYQLPNITKVSLSIYNILGQLVVILVNDKVQSAGIHSTHWDGKDEKGKNLPSGLYLFVLKTKSYVKVNKMLMIK